MARSRGAPADREGDRDHPRRQAGRQARADRRAPEAPKAVRPRRPREVATQNRGWQGFALGRSRREGGPRGSALRRGEGDLSRHELPAKAPAGGTGERGGADGGGPESEVIVSALTELETAVQLRAGWLAGEYRERRYRAYGGRLNVSRETEPFRFRALAGSLFQTALRQNREARRTHCRTLDRLHLAAMEELGLRRLMTSDTAQAAGGKALGFAVVSPGRR